ncbi:ribonuclease P protein component [Paludibacter sp. 221]|uniref:ribonuclease P protein component n=1 Tax=Paludibacter sp. 221 TaxID=2302939 RepID=UPI0013D35C06|nr:ribonuclease P protein component [Paludibacter sp. 221]NDV47308.1 ribonuclease P protein component [Paludibacter sp. 221]
MKPNSFPKAEHLCKEKEITRLFSEGKAFINYPFRVVYSVEKKENDVSVKVMVSVPKKRFKRAVKRNRLKRLMREAYRLNKNLLTEVLTEKELRLNIAFQYISDDEQDFAYIEKKMTNALNKIKEAVIQC